MKKYIKNITNDKEKFSQAVTLAFRENGKVIEIKPGEKIETKGNGTNVGNSVKLVYIEEKEEKKSKNTKKEMI